MIHTWYTHCSHSKLIIIFSPVLLHQTLGQSGEYVREYKGTFLRTRNFNTRLPRMESNRTVTNATKMTAISIGLFCFFCLSSFSSFVKFSDFLWQIAGTLSIKSAYYIKFWHACLDNTCKSNDFLFLFQWRNIHVVCRMTEYAESTLMVVSGISWPLQICLHLFFYYTDFSNEYIFCHQT